jgi:hypothetical protein
MASHTRRRLVNAIGYSRLVARAANELAAERSRPVRPAKSSLPSIRRRCGISSKPWPLNRHPKSGPRAATAVRRNPRAHPTFRRAALRRDALAADAKRRQQEVVRLGAFDGGRGLLPPQCEPQQRRRAPPARRISGRGADRPMVMPRISRGKAPARRCASHTAWPTCAENLSKPCPRIRRASRPSTSSASSIRG